MLGSQLPLFCYLPATSCFPAATDAVAAAARSKAVKPVPIDTSTAAAAGKVAVAINCLTRDAVVLFYCQSTLNEASISNDDEQQQKQCLPLSLQ